jgi:hypothetical protein
MVLPKRVYQLQDDSFEQFKPTTGSPAALALLHKVMRSPTSSRSSTPLNRSPCLSPLPLNRSPCVSPLASPVIGSSSSSSSFYGMSSGSLIHTLPPLAAASELQDISPCESQDFSMKPD